jgi:serralysin
MPAQPTALETYFLQLVNDARAVAGVQRLAFDGELVAAARDHSAWMDATDTASHTGAAGSSIGDRIAAAGYEATQYGENIWYLFGDGIGLDTNAVEQLHQSLMNSPGHRANLLNPSFEDVGIGVVGGDFQGRPAVFVTENFGTPTDAERTEPDDTGGAILSFDEHGLA